VPDDNGERWSASNAQGESLDNDKLLLTALFKSDQRDSAVQKTITRILTTVRLARWEMSDTKTKILIVDDTECTRTSMSLLLAEIGYRVRSAEDGFSALREIRQETPEILLSDLNMPRMSGFELLTVVRRRFPAILVIAMSGGFSGNEVPSGVSADAFFQKGSSVRALLQILRTPPQMRRQGLLPTSIWSPILIQQNRSDSSRRKRVAITCPDCLSVFSVAHEGSDCLMREIDCIHCGYSIKYAIVERFDQMIRPAFQQQSRASCPALSDSTFGN
jgi:CheY-like chemotaxis protein